MDTVIAFDKFQLRPAQRLLEADGRPVPIGGRAIDLLIALASRPQEVLSHAELMKQVWPNATVEASNLRFHIATLRKALGDGEDGARFIVNVQGRGYSFVPPISQGPPQADATEPSVSSGKLNRLPPPPPHMVRKTETVDEISSLLLQAGLVSLVGPGGIGKTTAALAVAHALSAEFEQTLFIDFSSVTEAEHLPRLIASSLGLPVREHDPTDLVLSSLRARRSLLVLDSCEHVIESVARFAEQARTAAPNMLLLVTSREALRIAGEFVHRIATLKSPPRGEQLSLEEALRYPAVELFFDRASLGGSGSTLDDASLQQIAEICRRVDGIALAIEIAAGQVELFGLTGVATMLVENFRLLWAGRRTAAPRHQTLQAMLDWSYDLLSSSEQQLLQRLSVFAAPFTAAMALNIVKGAGQSTVEAAQALNALLSKSLVATEVRSDGAVHRLLDTTRAYALSKLQASRGSRSASSEHARVMVERLADARQATVSTENETYRQLGAQLGNVRAALKWCFSGSGDLETGIRLASLAAPLLLHGALLIECWEWSEAALAHLEDVAVDPLWELDLQFARSQSLLLGVGNASAAAVTIQRGLELARALDDQVQAFRFMAGEQLIRFRQGDLEGGRAVAQKMVEVASALNDPAALSVAKSLRSLAHHRVGELAKAMEDCEAALSLAPLAQPISLNRFGYDHRWRARTTSARTLWILGRPDQAAEVARQVKISVETAPKVSAAFNLYWISPVLFWRGDWDAVEACIALFEKVTKGAPVLFHHQVIQCLRGHYLCKTGRVEEGMALIEAAIEPLKKERFIFADQLCAWAECLCLDRQHDRALAVIEDGIRDVQTHGLLVYLPEMLRIKGEILVQGQLAAAEDAAVIFKEAIGVAHEQGAIGHGLRAALELADLVGAAPPELKALYGRFTEGFDTPDLRRARRWITARDDEAARARL